MAIVNPVRLLSKLVLIAVATVDVLSVLSEDVSLVAVVPSTVTEYVVLSDTWLKNTIACVSVPGDKVESIAAVTLEFTTKVKSAIVIVLISDCGLVQDKYL